MRPILYSFRRCPYAIRARLALHLAGLRPGVDLELREVNLKVRPPELLEASPKGTVPVLVLADGRVIDESLEIMRWALQQRDPPEQAAIEALIAENDGPFKHHLDRFKYANRYPGAVAEDHRQAALTILRDWNARLFDHQPDRSPISDGWLLGPEPSLADWALLPFVRQFRLADPSGFEAEPGLETLRPWLGRFLASAELAAVMAPAWAPRTPWRSPRWLYHLALAEEWRAAAAGGEDARYRRSTRGLDLETVGFIHASAADQVPATYRRYFADAGEVLLLTIDPQRLVAAGVEVRWEAAPHSGERYPHLYGALPVAAVLDAARC
jgi:glutathione S-transferase